MFRNLYFFNKVSNVLINGICKFEQIYIDIIISIIKILIII